MLAQTQYIHSALWCGNDGRTFETDHLTVSRCLCWFLNMIRNNPTNDSFINNYLVLKRYFNLPMIRRKIPPSVFKAYSHKIVGLLSSARASGSAGFPCPGLRNWKLTTIRPDHLKSSLVAREQFGGSAVAGISPEEQCTWACQDVHPNQHVGLMHFEIWIAKHGHAFLCTSFRQFINYCQSWEYLATHNWLYGMWP